MALKRLRVYELQFIESDFKTTDDTIPLPRWEIQIDGPHGSRQVGTIEQSAAEGAFIVFDRSYIGRAYGQQRYFDDLVGRKKATFADIDEAKKFAAKQLKKYPDPPKKSDYLRQAVNN